MQRFVKLYRETIETSYTFYVLSTMFAVLYTLQPFYKSEFEIVGTQYRWTVNANVIHRR